MHALDPPDLRGPEGIRAFRTHGEDRAGMPFIRVRNGPIVDRVRPADAANPARIAYGPVAFVALDQSPWTPPGRATLRCATFRDASATA